MFTRVLETQHLGPFLSQVSSLWLLVAAPLSWCVQIVVILLPYVDMPECTSAIHAIFQRLFIEKQDGLKAFFR